MNGDRFYGIWLDGIRRAGKRRVGGCTRHRCDTHGCGASAVVISILVFLLLVEVIFARQRGLPSLDDGRRGAFDRSNVDVVVDQASHPRVARRGAASAEDDRHKVMVRAAHRRDDVETGIVDVAGLYAVDAIDRAEQVVVVANCLAADIRKFGSRNNDSISGSGPGLRGQGWPGRAQW